jgi:hypothetical protein
VSGRAGKTRLKGKVTLRDALKRTHARASKYRSPPPRSVGGAVCCVYRTSKRQEFVIEHCRDHEGIAHWYGKPTYLKTTATPEELIARILDSLCQYGRPFDRRRWRQEPVRQVQRCAVTIALCADGSCQVSEMQSHGHFLHEFSGRKWTARPDVAVDRLFRLILRCLGERV